MKITHPPAIQQLPGFQLKKINTVVVFALSVQCKMSIKIHTLLLFPLSLKIRTKKFRDVINFHWKFSNQQHDIQMVTPTRSFSVSVRTSRRKKNAVFWYFKCSPNMTISDTPNPNSTNTTVSRFWNYRRNDGRLCSALQQKARKIHGNIYKWFQVPCFPPIQMVSKYKHKSSWTLLLTDS